MKQTTGKDKSHPIEYNSWVFNYTSCANGVPLNMTRHINPIYIQIKRTVLIIDFLEQ